MSILSELGQQSCRLISLHKGKSRWHKRVSNPRPFDPKSYALADSIKNATIYTKKQESRILAKFSSSSVLKRHLYILFQDVPDCGPLLFHKPWIDGVLLPHSPVEALTTGQFNRVPVIIGCTRHEWAHNMGWAFSGGKLRMR